MSIIKPSYATGYAKNASQSAHPNLWDGLVGAFVPMLGYTGLSAKDVSGSQNEGVIYYQNRSIDDVWTKTPNGWMLSTVNNSGLKGVTTPANRLHLPEFTIVSLVQPIGFTNTFHCITVKENTYLDRNWFVGMFPDRQFAFVRSVNGQDRFIKSGVTASAGKFYSIACTSSASLSHAIYVNGIKKGSVHYGTPNSVAGINNYIGAYKGNNGYTAFSNIGSVLYFDRILSPSEIKQLYVDSLSPFRLKTRTVVRVPATVPTATKVGSFRKPVTIAKPSYQAGYARNASESENPKLWDGLVGAWMPSLGVTGETLRDVSGNGNDGTLTNMDAATDWVGTSKGSSLEFGYLTNEAVQVDPSSLNSGKGSFFCWYKQTSAMANNKDSVLLAGVTSGSIRNFLSVTSYITRSGQPVVLPSFNANNSFQYVIGPAVYLNEWMHFGYDWADGEPMRLWVNGKKYGETTNMFVDYGQYSDVKIGNYSSASVSASGVIQNAFSYNRALSPTEIKQLYVDSLAPFRRKQRVSVVVPAATPTPSATYHPLRSLAHPLEQ